MKVTKDFRIDDYDAFRAVFGGLDGNIRLLEEAFGVSFHVNSECLQISGEEENVEKAETAVSALVELSDKCSVGDRQIRAVVEMLEKGRDDIVESLSASVVGGRGKSVRPRSAGQADYCDAIRSNTIVFGIGPAGTGKTYLAVAFAVEALRKREVERIILTRPAVEAGEKLGFLPGDLTEKVDPYLRPLYDALQDLMGENYQRAMERGTVEIAPLAYMRGRTLNKSFIILDEAQNTTCEQMKMFLTRLGEGSRMVITGDDTQIDLPRNVTSGLKDAERVLRDVKDIAVVRLGCGDVVRHGLVSRIVKAYEKAAEEVARAERRAQYVTEESDVPTDGGTATETDK